MERPDTEKRLSFDMDEEIDDRNERQGRRAIPPRRTNLPMETSHAIILAAFIIVGGLWGGKLLYDYLQEQRIKAAFNEAAMSMQQTMDQLERDSQRARAESQRRMAEQAQADEARRLEQLARMEQERRLSSAKCQFWSQQQERGPSERTAQKKAEACNAQ